MYTTLKVKLMNEKNCKTEYLLQLVWLNISVAVWLLSYYAVKHFRKLLFADQ